MWEEVVVVEERRIAGQDGRWLAPGGALRRARQRAGVVLFGLVVTGCFANAQAQVDDDTRIRVAEALRRATVTIDANGSSGSGFIVGHERWVVTNAHVASAGGQLGPLLVRFFNGTMLPARLIAYDPGRDLAIAKVQGDVPVRPLPLGHSDGVRVGESVLAFGSPYGLEGTLTQGIVSARRDLSAIGAGDMRGVIQTDAPINPGNSGGPLVNGRGKVIGVNTAMLTHAGGGNVNGIGFAVPIRYVKELLVSLRNEARGSTGAARRVKRSSSRARPPAVTGVWLGFYGEDFRGSGYVGVRVVKVVPGGPADRAGLVGAEQAPPAVIRKLGLPWTGHILLALDNQPVRSMRELQAVLARRRPGDTALATVTVGPGAVSGETPIRLVAAPSSRTQP